MNTHHKPSSTPDPGVEGSSRPRTLTDVLRHLTRGLTGWLGRAVGRLGIHPDAITIAGLIPVGVAAVLAADGQFAAAGVLLVLGAPLDALDGAVARATGRQSRFGALLDSTTDRYADGFLFFGLAYYFTTRAMAAEMALAITALIGAFAVSYVRARAEGLNIRSIQEGLFDRVMRMLILIGALLTGWIVPGLAILAVGNHLTALHRLYIAFRATRSDSIRQ
jgi:CDP-diacylglycerol--glycerol-3-phosphate 3-phosphatidyltransferase